MSDPTMLWSEEQHPPRKRKRSVLRRALIVVSLLLVLVLVGGGLYASNYYKWCQGASGPQVAQDFSIPQGATGAEVISSMKDQGVLRCDAVNRYVVKKEGTTFLAGDYTLSTNMTLDSALAVLAKGPPPTPTASMTIPEGWRLSQIAAEAAKSLGVSEHEFLTLAQSGGYSLPPYLPKGSSTTEGFLFPKTYEFTKGNVTPDAVISRMLEQFQLEAKGLPWGNTKKLGITPYEAVIVASMIEREAANDAERPIIASVIYNRLASGTPLYIDATLEYVDPNPSDGLTESDIAMNSPYNTREIKGLPPTPIASPGLPSIKAALQPAHTDNVYYILCGSSHRFTPSYQQFIQWKDQCL
jgi:UPF0755 protein